MSNRMRLFWSVGKDRLKVLVYSQKPITMRGTEPATSQFMATEVLQTQRGVESRGSIPSAALDGGCTERRTKEVRI